MDESQANRRLDELNAQIRAAQKTLSDLDADIAARKSNIEEELKAVLLQKLQAVKDYRYWQQRADTAKADYADRMQSADRREQKLKGAASRLLEL